MTTLFSIINLDRNIVNLFGYTENCIILVYNTLFICHQNMLLEKSNDSDLSPFQSVRVVNATLERVMMTNKSA